MSTKNCDIDCEAYFKSYTCQCEVDGQVFKMNKFFQKYRRVTQQEIVFFKFNTHPHKGAGHHQQDRRRERLPRLQGGGN